MDSDALTQTLDGDGPSIILRFSFAEARYPFFLSVSSLFADLGAAHDLGVLVSYPEYERYRFGSRFWMRNGRPVEPRHQLRTFAIVKQSPLVLELIGKIAGALSLVQIIEKVSNWKLNRQKLELEVVRLRQDVALKEVEILEKQGALEEKLRRREAERIYSGLIKRFNESEFRLEDLDLRRARE